MKGKVLCLMIAGMVFLAFCQPARGLVKGSYTEEAPIKEKDFKHPTDWLELGLEVRLRAEYDDARNLNRKQVGHDRIDGRIRIRFPVKVKINDDLDFNIRLAGEPRYYVRPPSMNKQLTRHELLFDRLNFTWRNAFDMPLTIVAGRQDLKLGSSWLISDGTALDGGRTGFFDALRFTYKLDDDVTADLVLVSNHADSAKLLQPFNDRDDDFSEQDEQGGILYLAKKQGKDAGIDFYFIYQHDTKRTRATGSEGEIYTLGMMKYGRLDDNWQYCMEFAPQFGHKNGRSLAAFGTNNQLIYNFNDEKKNRIILGYEYLSGNDDINKNFDKGWGRIDTWSALYQGGIDGLDGRSADSSNMHRGYVEWVTMLTEKTEMRCSYSLLFADENTAAGGTGALSRSGIFRGQLPRVQIVYTASEHIKHQLEAEMFCPGNFYNNSANDPAILLRYNLIWTW
ncbi:MAG: alginate export family protein [Phycisphaerae bacterium]|nr:alginate export family protein [Phycisphaerae bacterium]